MSVLIWVQTVCKGYQQMTKVAASKERVKLSLRGLMPGPSLHLRPYTMHGHGEDSGKTVVSSESSSLLYAISTNIWCADLCVFSHYSSQCATLSCV